MKINFEYDKEKDIWCILRYGKGSHNSPSSTKTYRELIAEYGENPTYQNVFDFIEKYSADRHINFQEYINKYRKDWDGVTEEYQKRAEEIFGVSLIENVTVYLTMNQRCPYNIESNFFFASAPARSARKTIMHELWHFYTWHKFGITQEKSLGKQKYNDIKEALTALLNIEFKDLLPEGVSDEGYPQHKELREKIGQIWNETKNIEKVWEELIA